MEEKEERGGGGLTNSKQRRTSLSCWNGFLASASILYPLQCVDGVVHHVGIMIIVGHLRPVYS